PLPVLVLSTVTATSAGLYLLFALFTAPENPNCGGKKLSERLYSAYGPGIVRSKKPLAPRAPATPSTPEEGASSLAIQELGPRCLPMVQQWLTLQPTGLELR